MKIRSLEAVGFKSFVDRLHLSFPEGITTIVGPNGCGKSNFVDAILWAIGERSAKHLRGKLMEDVIFNGADGRKPLGMAEVSLTFSNEDGTAPIEYEAYSEITVTRRLYRSGESEYLINKTPCRLRDVTDLFLDTGIGVNGYSIVEQGRVERLINANPQDRRFLIEEAAGVAKYKERKRLALMKMEATQQNLLRIQDIIAEVKRQIVTLERQVKRAEEYKTIRKEVKEIELRFALHEYAELSEKGEAARGYLKALRDREMEISVQNAQKEAVVESNKLRAMEEEERLRILQQEIFEQGRKIQKAENDIEFFKREEGRFVKQEEEFVREVRESLRGWRASRQERKKLEQVRKGLEQEHRENEEIMREWETLYGDFRTTHQELLEELEDQKTKLIDTLTRMTSHQNRLVHLEERREDLQKRIRVNAEESLEASRSLKQLEETASEKITEKERCLSLLASFQEEKIQLEAEIKSLREISRQRQVERVNLEEMIRTDRSRYLSLKELQDNYEGYEKGVKSLLLQRKEEQEKWKGIMGAVADILEPDPRYEIPLEAVLGQRLQYLIVEGQKQGIEAMDFLKRESLGRGSFLPILPLQVRDGIEERVNGIGVENQIPSSPPSSLGGEEKGEGEEERPVPLSRFVNVKDGFKRIAKFLMEDIGVVEGLEEALHWTKNGGRFRAVVTMEGDIFESSGVISGGSRDQGLGLLERRREIRELEQRVKETEEECRKVREEEERVGRETADREIQLEERKRGIQEKEIELLHRERDLQGLGKETSQSQQRMEVILFEQKQLEEEQQDVDREKKEVSAQMEAEENAKREREGQVQSWKKKVEEVGEGGEELGARITEKKVVLASLEEKQKGLEVQTQNLYEVQRTLKEQILKKVSGIREFRGEATSLREKILQTEGELEEGLKQHHLQEEMLSTQKEKVEALLSEWKEGEASMKYLRRELEEVRQKMHEQEILTSEVQLKLSHLQESMKEKYGATLSTSIGNSLEEIPKEEMSNRLTELKRAMEGFGEVNLMAIEEYQELKQRHDFLSEQQSDLHQALDSLKKAILRINRTTTKRFLETFHQVNERFKEVFLRLFRGGQANLILLGEEDPANMGIDILAQPPGKKLQNIDLLSGGEKALVATALLFGIFMIKPTPFCLLDEVDAPLDDANINRFIELVKEFSASSQFILITHNKNTMEAARTLYGITMETPGVSKVVSVRLN